MTQVTVYTDNNLLANFICDLILNIEENASILEYQPLKLLRCENEIIVFNLIRSSHNIVATINFLNKYKIRLSRMIVSMIVPSKLIDLCLELSLFKISYLLTEKSTPNDYARLLHGNIPSAAPRKNILSCRERTILQLLLQEYSPQGVANELHISYKTVCAHKLNIMKKLQLKNLSGIFMYC
ncbi:hypothetical protein A9798_03815 [Edwardsiella hoshinae]|uniref:Spore germination protein gerE n=2 Tax=Edwardsiella hoshinae TaxID=93378 RepID=A0A376DA04_9GAMM|nr:hypothetical protein A9798_03815 [Edwardsiella hoshinae]QPR27959.1 helix-turn-helix transcriptional regulator [Edwardsiella hoshinae]STC85416.1 Spore germination protein gerE [Edwardsiella hoshinae]